MPLNPRPNEDRASAAGVRDDFLCECCEERRAVYDGLCRDCSHPDDVAFYESDPGEEYL